MTSSVAIGVRDAETAARLSRGAGMAGGRSAARSAGREPGACPATAAGPASATAGTAGGEGGATGDAAGAGDGADGGALGIAADRPASGAPCDPAEGPSGARPWAEALLGARAATP